MTLLSLRMPWRFLRGDRLRLLLTILALTCGVATVCALDLDTRGVVVSFSEVVETMGGRAALEITSGDGGAFGEGLRDAIAAVPGVQLAIPVVSANAFAVGDLIAVEGLPITDGVVVAAYEPRDSRRLIDPRAMTRDAVVLTRDFADHHGLALGGHVVLETPTGRRTLTVGALLDPRGVARVFGEHLAFMHLATAEELFTGPGLINRIDVVPSPGADVATIADAVRPLLPAGLRIERPGERKADTQRLIGSLMLLLQTFALTGLLAASLTVLGSLTTLFENRAWQLGVMRAVGVRSRAIWGELLKESLLLGMGGVALGVPIGVGVGRLLLPAIATSTALNFNLVQFKSELRIDPASLVIAALLGLGAALAAAVPPAWRVVRRGAAATIRDRGMEQSQGTMPPAGLAFVLVGSVTAAAVLVHVQTGSVRWGLLASVLIAVTAAAAARPFASWTIGRSTGILRRLTGSTGAFAAAALLRNPRRTGTTVATLGVGLGAVLWLWTVAQSFELSVIDTLTPTIRADLVVSSDHVASGYLESPITDALTTALREVAGVSVVAGERIAEWHLGSTPIAIDALDPAYLTSSSLGRQPLVGSHAPDVWNAVARGEAAIASTNLALNLRIRTGDTVMLDTPSGPLSLPVGGLVAQFKSPQGTLLVSRELYSRYWHDAKITRALVGVVPGTDVARVRDDLTRALGTQFSIRILSSADWVAYFAGQVRRAFAPIYVLAGLMLFLVLFGVGDALVAQTLERTREIGTIRALGVRRRQVQRMILIEAALLATLGVILMMATGLALGLLWVEATFPSLLGWVVELHLPYAKTAWLAVLTFGICAGAALLTGRRAARLDPAEALRVE